MPIMPPTDHQPMQPVAPGQPGAPGQPAASAEPGWLRWQLINGLIINTVVAMVLWIMVPGLGTFWVLFVHAQFIGFAIRSLIVLSLMRNRAGQRPVVTHRIVAIIAATVGGLVIGTVAAAWLTDTPIFFLDASVREKSLIPILVITALTSLIATAYFWNRESMMSLRARSEADHALAEQASRQASDAQLRMLRAQLEPHMLFNTLANLRALMSTDPPAAQHMLDRLISFLRATLATSRIDRVSLKDEFALLDDYLQLISIRLADRLSFTLKLPADLAGLQVLPLLLQPIVENAVRHGIEPALDGGSIQVSARRDGGNLRIEVADTGVGLDPHNRPQRPPDEPQGGFGLHQIRERLQNAYGDQASLTLAPNTAAGHGTIAVLVIPQAPQP